MNDEKKTRKTERNGKGMNVRRENEGRRKKIREKKSN